MADSSDRNPSETPDSDSSRESVPAQPDSSSSSGSVSAPAESTTGVSTRRQTSGSSESTSVGSNAGSSARADSSSTSSITSAAAKSTTGASRSRPSSTSVQSAGREVRDCSNLPDSSRASRVTSAAAESTTVSSTQQTASSTAEGPILKSCLTSPKKSQTAQTPVVGSAPSGSLAAQNPQLRNMLEAPSEPLVTLTAQNPRLTLMLEGPRIPSVPFRPRDMPPGRGTPGSQSQERTGRSSLRSHNISSPTRASPRLAAKEQRANVGPNVHSMKEGAACAGKPGKSPRKTSPSSMMSRTRIDSHGSELDDSSPDAVEGTEKQLGSDSQAAAGVDAAKEEIFSPGRSEKRSAEDVEEEEDKDPELFSPTKKFAPDPRRKPPGKDGQK